MVIFSSQFLALIGWQMCESEEPGVAYKLRHALWAVIMAPVRVGSSDHLERLNSEHLRKDWNLDSASEKVVSKYCEIYSLVWFEGDYEGWTDDEMDADTSNEFDEMWHASWEE